MSDALEVLVDKIIMTVDDKIAKLECDNTFKAVVWGINKDGTYVINYLGQTYSVSNSLGTELKLGQSVWVKIPNGILRNMHICGIVNGKSVTHNEGSTDIKVDSYLSSTSTNPVQNKVITQELNKITGIKLSNNTNFEPVE